MSTYVISGIQGCYKEFRSMLEKIRFSESDNLILAGDYIDRETISILEAVKNFVSMGKNLF
jgi:predicted MPP superfamily phosphohydrolase